MALFKVYHGDDLPRELRDSYGYIIVNEEENAGSWTDSNQQLQEYGIGEWYIDTNVKRYRIAAARLIDEDGNFYQLEDLAVKANLTNDLIDNVYDSNSGTSLLPQSDRTKLQVGFDVPNREDSISQVFSLTIPYTNWTLDGQYYKKVVEIPSNAELHCGDFSSVPPLIAWGGTGDKNIYDLLAKAEVNDALTEITFYVLASNYSAITQNISVLVIDHR